MNLSDVAIPHGGLRTLGLVVAKTHDCWSPSHTVGLELPQLRDVSDVEIIKAMSPSHTVGLEQAPIFLKR